MQKIKYILIFLFLSIFLLAQDVVDGKLDPFSRNRLTNFNFSKEAEKDSTHHWNYSLKNSLLFNQLYVDNWVAGGVNSYSGTIKINAETYYKKNKHRWTNQFNTVYGVRNQDDQVEKNRKTEDGFDFTSSYKYSLKKNWYLGSSFIVRSQWSKGYTYTDTDKTKISNIFSPGYITIGVGVDYVVKDIIEVSVHPISSRTVIVLDDDLKAQYNIDQNSNKDISIGLYTGIKNKWKPFKNVDLSNTLGLYSEYSHKPLNLAVAYRLNIDMKINDFMKTNINVEMLYDENQIAQLQVKQTLGVGLVYNIDNFGKQKDKSVKKDIKNKKSNENNDNSSNNTK